eukprot:3428083-Heterocapsa_arctica.AAC.1
MKNEQIEKAPEARALDAVVKSMLSSTVADTWNIILRFKSHMSRMPRFPAPLPVRERMESSPDVMNPLLT